jgi:hypothetical protein
MVFIVRPSPTREDTMVERERKELVLILDPTRVLVTKRVVVDNWKVDMVEADNVLMDNPEPWNSFDRIISPKIEELEILLVYMLLPISVDVCIVLPVSVEY